MRSTLIVVAVLGGLFWSTNSYAEESNTYTLTGKLLRFGDLDRSGKQTKEEGRLDPSSLHVVVSYERLTESGETETVELDSGGFVDDKVLLRAKVSQPREIKISVQVFDDETLSANALITPGGEEITFALVEHLGVEAHSRNLYLLGSSRRSMDPAKKFSISGNFESLDEDLTFATVQVSWKEYVDGEFESRTLGTVMVEDSSFLLEADIEDPEVAQIFVSAVPEHRFLSFIDAVIEPGAEIKLVADRSGAELIATAEKGRHALLIDSWQQSEDYFSKQDAYEQAYADFMDEKSSQQAAEEPNGTEEIPLDPADSLGSEKVTSSLQTAEGCEHIEITAIGASIEDTSELALPKHEVLWDELAQTTTNALQRIARDAEDPMNSLLAMELGAFPSRSNNREDAFPVYEKLAKLLDPDLVARRVTPRHKALTRFILEEENDKRLVQGQLAPDFTLPNLEGTDVALEDVLAANEIVLLDFWASWCGPCIASFPDLKQLHADYKDSGFEIIAISIDSTHEEWEEGSEEQELPWVSLGEIEGWNGPVSGAYGVQEIPRKYLIDTHGCILNKNPSVDALREILVERYGVASTSETSEDVQVLPDIDL